MIRSSFLCALVSLFSGELCIQTSCSFGKWGVCFLTVDFWEFFMNSGCKSLSSNMSFASNFFQPVACLFIILTMSFEDLLILMQPNLSIDHFSPFMGHDFAAV